MSPRPHNFNAGPAILPAPVLEEAAASLMDTNGRGLSILEWSHRSPEYSEVHGGAEAALRELLGLDADTHRVMFLQGGASMQFAQVPMNLATPQTPGDYVVTGVWSKKALAEAKLQNRGRGVWSGDEVSFTALPEPGSWSPGDDAGYVHITTNNTIYGTEWKSLPDTGGAPLIADMSSDIMSGPLDMDRFGLIYAGAQKNLGPAGVTLVIARNDLLERCPDDIPKILNYHSQANAGSLYNTPPTFAIYLMGLTFKWIMSLGGLAGIDRMNEEKATLLYGEIDRTGFYKGTAVKKDRSRMNVPFRLQSEDLEKKFLQESNAAGFVGLKGHRSVGGCRASTYNALPLASVQALVDFMREFESKNG